MSASSGAVAWQALEEIRRDVAGYLATALPSPDDAAAGRAAWETGV